MEGAIIAAAKEKGCELVPFDAQASAEKQLDHVQIFANGGYDTIIVNLTDTNAGKDVIELVGWDKPLVFVDRRPDDDLLAENLRCYVGAEEYLAGQYQAEWLAKHFKDKADKTLNVVIFKGRLGLENTEMRTLGAVETLQKAGFTVNKVFEDTADFDRAIAVDKMATFLGTGIGFDCVIANNDEMALGVIEAMELADTDPSKTPIVGIDGTEMGFEAIKNGKMAATAYQSPVDVGKACFEQAYEVLTTGKMASFKDVPFILVDKSNLAEYM
jgi:inositol transport system substrate-binding protein